MGLGDRMACISARVRFYFFVSSWAWLCEIYMDGLGMAWDRTLNKGLAWVERSHLIVYYGHRIWDKALGWDGYIARLRQDGRTRGARQSPRRIVRYMYIIRKVGTGWKTSLLN